MQYRRTTERLLGQNSELAELGVWNWTLPAWAGRLPDGRTYNTCPAAGICSQVCYARNGTYLFPEVKAKHERNLARVLDNVDHWAWDMATELAQPRFRGGRFVRVHDAGDFFSDDYLAAWLWIARDIPDVTFYAYTKQVDRFRRLAEGRAPANFLWVYSYGGREDHLLDPDVDRVADVFPSEQVMAEAGFHSQEASDLLAVLGPPRVGIVANRIPHFVKRLDGRSFREWQAEWERRDTERRAARSGRQR